MVKNGPQAKEEERQQDVRVMRRQDVALEGLGDVFGQAEQRAENVDRMRQAYRRMVNRQADRRGRERQDEAIEGLGDVFARAEQRASIQQQARDRINQQLRAMRAGRDVAKEVAREAVMNDKSIDSLSRRASVVGIKNARQVFKGPGMMDRIREAIIGRL